MNPEYCLTNLQDKNIFNLFDFQHILNDDNSDPDFFSNKFDLVDSPNFSLEEICCKVEKLLENCFMSILGL